MRLLHWYVDSRWDEIISEHGGHQVQIPREVGTDLLIGGISKITQA